MGKRVKHLKYLYINYETGEWCFPELRGPEILQSHIAISQFPLLFNSYKFTRSALNSPFGLIHSSHFFFLFLFLFLFFCKRSNGGHGESGFLPYSCLMEATVPQSQTTQQTAGCQFHCNMVPPVSCHGSTARRFSKEIVQ